jgi:hypothetical protein
MDIRVEKDEIFIDVSPEDMAMFKAGNCCRLTGIKGLPNYDVIVGPPDDNTEDIADLVKDLDMLLRTRDELFKQLYSRHPELALNSRHPELAPKSEPVAKKKTEAMLCSRCGTNPSIPGIPGGVQVCAECVAIEIGKLNTDNK